MTMADLAGTPRAAVQVSHAAEQRGSKHVVGAGVLALLENMKRAAQHRLSAEETRER